jgi:hypothetical protein
VQALPKLQLLLLQMQESMMKNILTIVLFSITIYTARAQDKPLLPMSVILNGTINLTSLEPHEYLYSPKAGLGFGGGAQFRTDGDVFLLGGLQYLSVNPTIADKSSDKSEKITLTMLQIPVMAGIHFVKSHDSKRCLHGQIGASFSILLDVADNGLGIKKENLWSTGFTFKAGVGADLYRFVVDLHYNLLLTHVYEESGWDNKSRLVDWEFTVGYKIDIGKKGKGENVE